MTEAVMSLNEAHRGKTKCGGSGRWRGWKIETIKHIYPAAATASSKECPCKMILHMIRKLIKNNKTTMGGELANRDKVHG